MHFDCAVEAAKAKTRSWFSCSTCEQVFTGALRLRLARERCRLSADRPEEDGERMAAALDLTEALRASGELDEALPLGIAALSTTRRVHGDEHQWTLDAMGRLACAWRLSTGR